MDRITAGSIAVLVVGVPYLCMTIYYTRKNATTRWAKVRATIVNLDVPVPLIDERWLGSDRFGHKIKIEYEYEIARTPYRSARITLNDGVLISNSYRDLAKRLVESRQSAADIDVLVDESDPKLAVLTTKLSSGGLMLSLIGISLGALLLVLRT